MSCSEWRLSAIVQRVTRSRQRVPAFFHPYRPGHFPGAKAEPAKQPDKRETSKRGLIAERERQLKRGECMRFFHIDASSRRPRRTQVNQRCRETRKKKRMTPDTDKADTPSRHSPSAAQPVPSWPVSGLQVSGLSPGADRPTFPCKSTVVQMGDESLRGRLLTVAGAAHVGRSKRLRVSRLIGASDRCASTKTGEL